MKVETVPLDTLTPHPRNYRHHPADQLDHLVNSIQEHGLYRNIIIARDGTILAGHGVVEAATVLGIENVPVVRLPLDPDEPRALKVLAGDNEISRLADIDDRMLSELLKEIKNTDPTGLAGTGYDEMQLANLAYVTRSRDEIEHLDAAQHWVGLPSHDPGTRSVRVIVNFRSHDDRASFGTLIGQDIPQDGVDAPSIWWPPREREDLQHVAWIANGATGDA
jgi:hypothetical protein